MPTSAESSYLAGGHSVKKPEPTVEIIPCDPCEQSGQRWWKSGAHWVMCQVCNGRGWRIIISQGRVSPDA